MIPHKQWVQNLSSSPRDSLIYISSNGLPEEEIGKKERVHDLFDRWILADFLRDDRGRVYAEVTDECRGRIEPDFALTFEQWRKPEIRCRYYRAVNDLIEKTGCKLLTDFGSPFDQQEKELFLRALKTLAWQESRWQHYIRYKNCLFVIVSGGSYNKLDDWGITQLARSSFDAENLLNEEFFEHKGYCSISSSLYYGFMYFYFCYQEAQKNPQNGSSTFNKIIGAYNLYSSGYGSGYAELADHDEGYGNYQIRAMGKFKDWFILEPWNKYMDGSAEN